MSFTKFGAMAYVTQNRMTLARIWAVSALTVSHSVLYCSAAVIICTNKGTFLYKTAGKATHRD